MPSPILLSGGSGFLGWSFVAEAPPHSLLLPLRREIPALRERAQVEHLLLEDEVQLRQFWKQWHPRALIHAAACADPRLCEEQPVLSRYINETLPTILAELCAEADVPMVHVSSDLVFNGRYAPYIEEDSASPLSAYGWQKARAEKSVLAANPKAWVIRLPLLYGESGPWSRNGLAEQWDRLLAGQTLQLFCDEYRTPARSRRIARFVLNHLGDFSGVMNLGGPERLSRLQMGESLCRITGGDSGLIKSVRQCDLNLGTERPADVSLKSDRAKIAGYRHDSFEEELLDIQQRGRWVKSGF